MFFRLVVVLFVTQYLVLPIPMVVVLVDGDDVFGAEKIDARRQRDSSSWFLVVRNLSHT